MGSPVVIVGGSTAGLSAARELRTQGYDGDIQVLDSDPRAPFRRPAVSKGILSGAQSASDVAVPWPDALGLQRVTGTATGLDLEARLVHASDPDGATFSLPFASLVIATGTAARPLPMPGGELASTLRGLEDGESSHARLQNAKRIVIVGGGFIGLEAAAVARGMGKDVTVVEAAPLPLAHAVGTTLGWHIAELHRTRGVSLVCGVGVASIHQEGDGFHLVLSSGATLEADFVLGAVGSAPVTGWLQGSGLDIANGVRCDATCAVVGAEGVVAAGDVATWPNPLYGRLMRVEHWANAIEQGTFAARTLMGTHDSLGFSSAPYFWSDQYELKIQSIGSAAGHDESVVLEHDGERIIVAYGRDGALVGVAGVNTGPIIPKYRPMIDRRELLSALPRVRA